MDWFKPTAETVAFVAEACLTIVVLGYVFSLKQKGKSEYLFMSLWAFFFLYAFANIFVYSAFPTTTPFLKLVNGAVFGLLAYSWLVFAHYFPKNYHPKESIVALLLLAIPTVYTWFSADPSTFTLGTLSAYVFLLVYLVWHYGRKMKETEKRHQATGAGSRLQVEKEKNFYRTFMLAISVQLISFVSLFLVSFELLSFFFWTVVLHVTSLVAFTLQTYAVLNYSRQVTSFRAKLTGIVLCVVLIVLGIMPFLLLGETWFDQTGNRMTDENTKALPQKIIHYFMLLIPAVTVLIVFFFPWLFKNVILRPLGQILSGMQKVNAGDLDTDVAVEVNDEIGALSRNFNQMTASLQRYAGKMNDLVDERTAALNQSLQDLKSTQAQLIQSEKMASLGELTAGIAHEIQNPLNFVNNFSDVNRELIEEASEGLKSGDLAETEAVLNDIRQNLEKISHHGQRADAIVKGMLQHSPKSTGQKEPTDINALCDEYLRLSYHDWWAKNKSFNADLKTDFDKTIEKIAVVPQDIGRVLLNLFNNAFYAANERSTLSVSGYHPMVEVKTRRTADKAEIMVSDNGAGISQTVIDKVFQPFFTTKPTGQGTGLGLSLAYDIITKEHGGSIKAESVEGKGTSFIIHLPVNQHEQPTGKDIA